MPIISTYDDRNKHDELCRFCDKPIEFVYDTFAHSVGYELFECRLCDVEYMYSIKTGVPITVYFKMKINEENYKLAVIDVGNKSWIYKCNELPSGSMFSSGQSGMRLICEIKNITDVTPEKAKEKVGSILILL